MAKRYRLKKVVGYASVYHLEKKAWFCWKYLGSYNEANGLERIRDLMDPDEGVICDTKNMTPESKVKKQVKKILYDLGVYYFMPSTGGYGDSGVPDFVGCVAGKMVGIECKAGKNTPTELQLKHKRDIEASGGVWLLVNENNLEELTLKLIYLKENKS